MMGIRKLRIGTKIKSEDGRATGSVGLIARREGFPGVYALTMAHAIRWGQVFIAEAKLLAGHRTGRTITPPARNSCTSLIAWFRLGIGVVAEAAPDIDFASLATPLPPTDCLGLRVKIFGADPGISNEYVSAICVCAPTYDPDTGEIREFEDFIQVTSIKEDRPFSKPGDLGKLVCTEAGQPVGLILGGSGLKTFLCPIEPILRSERFKPMLLEDYAARNAADLVASPVAELELNCLKDPDRWVSQVEASRSRLHDYFAAARDHHNRIDMERMQNELAHTLFETIQFQRFCNGLVDLHFLNDAPNEIPSENWMWRALVERLRLVEPSANGLTLSYRRADQLETHSEFESGDVGLWIENSSKPRVPQHFDANPGEYRELADAMLGSNLERAA